MVVQDNLRTDLVSSPLKNDKKHRLKQRFDVQRKLGQGTYGKVQLAVNRETGQEVAVKTIKKNKIENEQDLIRIRREIQIMSSIQHPHITHIYEVFENKDKIVLVMQFASGGELYDYLSEKKVLSDLEARRIFRQIAAAVYYCHKNKICHRDLKLENILLDEKGNAKIADFGLSNVFDQKNLLNTYCGSPLYASPEIVKGVPYYGPEVDCWSMGVLLYTLVYGAMPFDGSNFRKLVTQISEGDYFEPKKKSNASELIRKLLTVNPSRRATIVDICVDYWVNLGYEHCLLQVAEDMANLTPVRLDLLLALAPDASVPQEEAEKEEEEQEDTEKDPVDEEDEDDEEYNDDTAANSFAFMKGSHASQLSISSPNLQKVGDEYEDDDEFLPADIAVALQAECGKRQAEGSFADSLSRISSLAHQSKKPKKSESSKDEVNKGRVTEGGEEKKQVKEAQPMTKKNGKSSDVNIGGKSSSSKLPDVVSSSKPQNSQDTEKKNLVKEASNVVSKTISEENTKVESEKKELLRKDSVSGTKSTESPFITQRKESFAAPEEKVETKKFVRPPGKIMIPKTFDSPQSTPSPKPGNCKTLIKNSNSCDLNEPLEKETVSQEAPLKEITSNRPSKNSAEDINKNTIESEPEKDTKANVITEEKKNAAKSILKKGIAKAKLAERRMSKQGSTESDVASSCSTPVSAGGTPDPAPSFFKAPKPYTKEENTNVTSKAEIKLSSTQSSNATLKNSSISTSNAPLWESGSRSDNRQLPDRNLNWSTISSTIDSEMSSWREQMEESLRRLSPEDERTSKQSYALTKVEDDKPLVPIARSYKKFTFTKDGACITETKKIYTTPGADGSWTKVEKKTKITTRPGNVEEFEKFRDLHLRTDSSPSLVRSDSQSSSGSNDVYDDIFDSWTGDTMMCNVRKMNNMFQKFSRDPFLRRERRRNPFRLFQRTESERNDRERTSSRSIAHGTSENEEDCDVHFDDSNAAVYGSQGLWQLLRTANRGFPGRVSIQHDPSTHSRSASQDRSDSKFETNWRRCGSKASSGYNTGTRSQSRDRTESPREKVLRFVFESPREGFSSETSVRESPGRHEKWSVKRNLSRQNPRRDSGVGSDGYESEYSIRHSPSDEMSRTGRVSSISSVASDKQGMIRNFMKSWSKDFMSPPVSPTSPGSSKEQLGSLPESKKHRVEQWLDMNSGSMPFDKYSDGHSKLSSRKSTTSHCNNSAYATMRPREYLQYNRSSSDKLADCSDFFPSFEDSHQKRSQSLNKNESLSEMGKLRFRGTSYSPVSEESIRDIHAARINENFGPAVHQINFTFSDGRAGSSQIPQTTRYVKQFSNSNDGCITIESPPSGNFRVEQVSGRSPAQPVVQMRVSINRSNPIASPPVQSSKGLWEQQDSLRSPIQDTNSSVGRESSPVPGIRQFSTEVQHCVGTLEGTPKVSVQCEVTKSDKPQTGKNSTSMLQLPAESCIWDMASCMKDSVDLTNINKHGANESSCSNNLSNCPKSLILNFQKQVEPVKCQSDSTNGVNTPDSLEDLNAVEQFIESDKMLINECFRTDSNESSCDGEGLQPDVKPLGVLWSNQSNQNSSTSGPNVERCSTFVKTRHSSTSSIRSDESDLQKKCIENTTSEIGSIWNQKKSCHPFDLLKNILSDDGLDSFSSSKCVVTSSSSNENSFPDLSFNNENMFSQSSIVGKHISVIDNIEYERLARGDKFHKAMPSLMEDLQSPKEVLRQALKICDSLEPC